MSKPSGLICSFSEWQEAIRHNTTSDKWPKYLGRTIRGGWTSSFSNGQWVPLIDVTSVSKHLDNYLPSATDTTSCSPQSSSRLYVTTEPGLFMCSLVSLALYMTPDSSDIKI